MITVIIDNNSLTGRRLLKDIRRHPRVAKVISADGDLHEQFERNFDEDCTKALTPKQFIFEMEQRINRW